MKTGDCIGCRENFYNGNNEYGIVQCWHFDKKKKLIKRFRIHMDAPMGNKNNYIKEKRPPCYSKPGGIYVDQIPEYAK